MDGGLEQLPGVRVPAAAEAWFLTAILVVLSDDALSLPTESSCVRAPRAILT